MKMNKFQKKKSGAPLLGSAKSIYYVCVAEWHEWLSATQH